MIISRLGRFPSPRPMKLYNRGHAHKNTNSFVQHFKQDLTSENRWELCVSCTTRRTGIHGGKPTFFPSWDVSLPSSLSWSNAFFSSFWLQDCAGSIGLSEPISSTCTSSRPGRPGGVTIVASCNYKIVKMHVSIEKLLFF